jgi:hypothetical protein
MIVMITFFNGMRLLFTNETLAVIVNKGQT